MSVSEFRFRSNQGFMQIIKFRLLSQIKFGNISKKCLDDPGLVRSTFAIFFNMLLVKYVKITIIAKQREMMIIRKKYKNN
ncbi:hypothetical protein JCM16775_2032 [Leptotrichia hofstadii]|uniref:Uncharacterized protein n=1 Tax=Leptotrichia hofstadii TaxID=157688 RepID=A0A510JLQ4_9FUSO|nr:hypothetical protein JCM16775_2032 [Leptotrichia hofstadii]